MGSRGTLAAARTVLSSLAAESTVRIRAGGGRAELTRHNVARVAIYSRPLVSSKVLRARRQPGTRLVVGRLGNKRGPRG
jgi:hypothetical protein